MGTLGDRIQDLLRRLGSYPFWEVLIELLVIGAIAWFVVRFVKGTRAAGALRGILVLFVLLVAGAVLLRILGGQQAFPRLTYLMTGLLQVGVLALIVVFQPELRRALIRLGESMSHAPFMRSNSVGSIATINAIVESCSYLSKAKFGAILAVERKIGLLGLIEGGTVLDSAVSSRLLQTIFFPGSALHDLAVLVRGDRLHAAGVQLPLAEPEEMPNPSFGSRHRAAVGLTKECDAIAIVVSEETGRIRIAERGRLSEAMTPDELRAALIERLTGGADDGENTTNDAAVFEESGSEVAGEGDEPIKKIEPEQHRSAG